MGLLGVLGEHAGPASPHPGACRAADSTRTPGGAGVPSDCHPPQPPSSASGPVPRHRAVPYYLSPSCRFKSLRALIRTGNAVWPQARRGGQTALRLPGPGRVSPERPASPARAPGFWEGRRRRATRGPAGPDVLPPRCGPARPALIGGAHPARQHARPRPAFRCSGSEPRSAPLLRSTRGWSPQPMNLRPVSLPRAPGHSPGSGAAPAWRRTRSGPGVRGLRCCPPGE